MLVLVDLEQRQAEKLHFVGTSSPCPNIRPSQSKEISHPPRLSTIDSFDYGRSLLRSGRLRERPDVLDHSFAFNGICQIGTGSSLAHVQAHLATKDLTRFILSQFRKTCPQAELRKYA
jgi:hypothetical protein